jgi:hypothetical protein
MAANNQDNDFFFDPEHDESEGPSTPPSFSTSSRDKLEIQRDFLERLLLAWQSAHSDKKKKAA